MPVTLTETAISKAAREAEKSGKRRDLADAKNPGLRLRLTPNGAKSWVLACRDRDGRMRRFPLGAFPTVSISDAREAAKTTLQNVRQAGADPIAEAKRRRAVTRDAKEGVGTLAALLTLYAEKVGEKQKRWKECRQRIESVFEKQLQRALATLPRGDLQLAADSWRSAASAGAAVRYLRPILKWAAKREYAPADLANLIPPSTIARRDRVLSRDELEALLPVLRDSHSPYAAAMRFMLLTLSRREEVGAAKWGQVNLETGLWTIAETKNGMPHAVPLPRQAVELLRARIRKDDEGKEIRPKPDALLFASATGARLMNWDREAKTLMESSQTSGWTRHDLRRTGATMLGEMGELPDIIEAALNHVSIRSPLAATYNRSRYRPQVASALQRLADALDGIEAGAAKVVPLHGGA
jgi:integrase